MSARFTRFPAGTRVVSFAAVAATPGSFVLPPVKAWVEEQPELMGLSEAGVFIVCPGPKLPPAGSVPLVRDPGFGEEPPAGGGIRVGGDGGGAGEDDVSAFGAPPPECAPGRGGRPPVLPAKSCPRACSGGGVCNIASGACLCNEGLTGPDCSKPSPS